ncbi:MAG: arginase family protein [Halobacteriales archaeon]
MFPGAAADPDGSRYVILGAPLDATTSHRPGARFGPDLIRRAAHAQEDYDRRRDTRFSERRVHDAGDVLGDDAPERYLPFLETTLRGHVLEGRVPVVLGGEHTVSLAGVRATEPATYVALDAHLDLRDRYRGRERSHATVCRRALEVVDRAIVVGARSGSEAEWDRASAADVEVVEPEAVAAWTPTPAAPIYLSVDVDVLDPAFAPGTGTLSPFGLTPATVRDLVTHLAPHASGFDVVEVNDRDEGQAPAVAAALVRRFVHDHAEG